MSNNTFLLYGANGYTGELIARFASEYNLAPILAGRNQVALKAMADKLKLDFEVIDLENTAALEAALRKVKVVVNAAGPFDATCVPMVKACFKTGAHYLDINGDIAVFETLKQFDEKALKADIMVMPGTGFDVVPTDCLALYLKKQLPDASSLKLAFVTVDGGGISHGTAQTMASKMGIGGAKRKDGKIVSVPLGQNGMTIDFPTRKVGETKKRFVMSIPWGDISTAYTTTGIPNIETFTGADSGTFNLLKFQGAFNWLLRTKFARKMAQSSIKKKITGPSDSERIAASGLVWGEATSPDGRKVEAALAGPEGYTLTYHSTLIIVQKILNGDFKPGYQTPAKVYGADLILEVPNMVRHSIKAVLK